MQAKSTETPKRFSLKQIYKVYGTTLLNLLTLGLIVQAALFLLPSCSLVPQLNSPWFIAGIALAIFYRVVNTYGWTLVLRAMGQEVAGPAAARIWLLGESRRWLPGSVWAYASRATLAKELNVSASTASASMLLELLLTLIANAIVIVPAIILFRVELYDALKPYTVNFAMIPIILLCLCLLVIMGKLFLSKAESLLKKLASRFGFLNHCQLNWPKLVLALAFLTGMAVLNGASTICLILSLPLESFPPISMVIAATSTAWIIGFFAIFAPGGLVVREAVFAACLVYWLPASSGVAIAVLSRLVQIAAEFVCLFGVSIKCIKKLGFNRLFSHPAKAAHTELSGNS